MSEVEAQLLGDFQYEIYGRGLAGERPALPLAPVELERLAREAMSEDAFGYVAGGAGAEATARANLEAFARRQIVPRMLRDVSVD
jgi:lactate 2-monooxygenase